MIDQLTDQQKSVLLVKALGWTIERYEVINKNGEAIYPSTFQIDPKERPGNQVTCNLYDPVNMALAKRAIAWGFENDDAFNEWLSDKTTALEVLIQEHGIRRALDFLVEPLAIEAGLVALEEERG